MNAPLDLLALRIDAALAALRAGRPVIVSDDADREDEADLILAADTLSVTEMARMIRDGSGIVCLCLTAEHAARLELPLMVAENRSRHGTAFTVSIEAAEGVSTGVSALAGNPDNVAALRRLFLDELPMVRDALAGAAERGDVDAMRADLHRLRASCGFVGAARLDAAASMLREAPLSKAALRAFLDAAQDALSPG